MTTKAQRAEKKALESLVRALDTYLLARLQLDLEEMKPKREALMKWLSWHEKSLADKEREARDLETKFHQTEGEGY